MVLRARMMVKIWMKMISESTLVFMGVQLGCNGGRRIGQGIRLVGRLDDFVKS